MSKTLLLADDSVTIQRVIELTFADEDVEVVAVSDGEQAIAAVDQRPPDIVLADVGMPGRDGYQVAQHIKSTPRLAHIPVVLLTGAFEPIDQARAAQVGCDGVLAKPFEPQLVIGRVKELLAKRSQAAPGGHAAAPSAPSDLALISDPPPSGDPAADDYFDQLDQAFATLTSSAPKPPVASPPADPFGGEGIDWFSQAPPAQPYETPGASTPAAPPPPMAHPAAATAAAASQGPGTPAAAFPPLADAFSALLAAEQAGPAATVAPTWPAAAPTAGPTPELVDEVTRRVLARMGETVHRDEVADIVTRVAEQLVREEIERIKDSIK